MGINGKFGDSNCSFDGDKQFKFTKYSIEALIVGLFDPNPFYQTVRLNALYCMMSYSFSFCRKQDEKIIRSEHFFHNIFIVL
jgi:hypothetical protein